VTSAGTVSRTFSFGLSEAGFVTLSIYDVSGRLVAAPLSGVLESGAQLVQWDGRNSNGQRLGQGIYFAHLRAPGREETIKVLVLRR
jgi:flagellar hook assembly protein FlgD